MALGAFSKGLYAVLKGLKKDFTTLYCINYGHVKYQDPLGKKFPVLEVIYTQVIKGICHRPT